MFRRSGLAKHAFCGNWSQASLCSLLLVDAGKSFTYIHSSTNRYNVEPVSLAKSLACLPNETTCPLKRKVRKIKISPREYEEDITRHVSKLGRNVELHPLVKSGLSNDECNVDTKPVSLAKSLACLPDESSTPLKRRIQKRMELKRSIEMRIKKRVKECNLNGRFYHLLERVIANVDTLKESYDIIRLNSNVSLAAEGDEICFNSMAEQLRGGCFDIQANIISFSEKSLRNEFFVLPNLKLRVIQEAIRVVLEVVYRPCFSKISHGCRSGRGRRSALRYIRREIDRSDWWFTLAMKKRTDTNILHNLTSILKEKIEDTRLFSIIQRFFDAQVLNLEFGGFPKGQGLPQEGILSPILMNIYLHNLDTEIFRMFMRYEGLGFHSTSASDRAQSKLRSWFRRQMGVNNTDHTKEDISLRLHACRYMDEIFIAVLGSKEMALCLKNEIQNYVKHSLYLNVDDQMGIVAVDKNSYGVQFLGTNVRPCASDCEAVRAVHRLKDKIRLFSAQKQEIWDASMARIGKKWLAHGLKMIKESEIKQLGLSNPMLDKISCFRKDGMRTDHWFKSLLKIWLQDLNVICIASGEAVLSKYIAVPSVPEGLKDSFFNFQKHVEKYISSETASTLALLSDSTIDSESSHIITKMEAPISSIRKKLLCYGVLNTRGFPTHVSSLMLQDDILIVHWFSGLVQRWLKWYHDHDNFGDLKRMMVEYIKMSCIRTLAAKHRMHESLIEKRFELEINTIPLTEDLETDMALMASNSASYEDDESLTYGISYSGLCMLSLAEVPLQPLRCFAMGCPNGSSSMYTLHVREQQKFPGWITGFSASIHRTLNGEKVALCNEHVKDLYLGRVSLQALQFGSLKR